MSRLNRLLREDEGQDLVEYGLLASLISIATIVTVSAIGPLLKPLYQGVHIALRFARTVLGI